MSRGAYLWLAVATRAVTDIPLLWMFLAIHFGMRGSGNARDAVWNGVLFAAWAALHSLLAREAPKGLLERVVSHPYVRVAYVMISGVTLALLLLFWRPVSGEVWHATGPLAWLLGLLYLASLVALVYIASRFDYLEFIGLRSIRASLTGRTPGAPVLSVKGPYGYCRHPMYLAMLAAFWIGPVMSTGRLEFVTLGTLYLLVGLRLEEGNLRRELGPPYDLYRANVPMLIPRLTRWDAPTEEPDIV